MLLLLENENESGRMERFKSCVHFAHAPTVTAHVPFQSGPQETGASKDFWLPSASSNCQQPWHACVSATPPRVCAFVRSACLVLEFSERTLLQPVSCPSREIRLGAVVLAVALLHLETCPGVLHPGEGPDRQKAAAQITVHGHQTVSTACKLRPWSR